MTPERWQFVESFYHAALEQPIGERAAFLDRVLANDRDARAEVESLLAASDRAASFLDAPALHVAARRLAGHGRSLAAGEQIGQYRIDAPIGRGGMGEVWRARDTVMGRDVAIKVLTATFADDPDRLRRFEQEARAVGQLNHPNIVTIYAVGRDAGVPYLITELLEGETLQAVLGRGALAAETALDYAIQIARGLAAAHQKGIVHRDLKPANVFVARDGRVKILDFGVAKLTRPIDGMNQVRSASGVLLGTSGYAAPEHVKGEGSDHRGDLFGFGAILYEMLSGRRAFEGDSSADVLNAVLHDEPPPLVGVSRQLERTVRRCLAKNPDDRFQSAEDLVAHLEVPRTKHRWLLAAAAAAMLVAALGWMWSSERRRPVLGFAERDLVLIGTVENTTSDRVLDGTLATALTISLEQSQYVTLLPPARVRAALQRMRRPPDETLTEELAREICLREGARALLAGAVTSNGREFLLTVRIIDPSSGALVRSARARAASKDEVLAAVDSVASSVRVALGESLPSIARDSRTLAEATTSSLEALRDYTAAVGFLAREQRSEAEALLVRAIELDPDFARAYAARAAMYRGYGIIRNTALAERYFQEALKRLDHVTERERLEIEALYHGAMGRYERAAGLYRLLVERHPAVSEYHFYLGRQYQGLRRFAAAIPEYLEAIRLNPTSSEALIRLANCYSSAKQHAQARTAYERAFALEPSWEIQEIQNHQYGWDLVMAGDEDAARATFGKMVTAGPFKRARGLRSFGLLALYRGQLSEAKQKLDEARAFNEKDFALSAARDRLYLAEAQFLFGRRGDAIQELDRGALLLEGIEPPSAFICLRYAALYAMAGRIAPASRWLAHGRRFVTNDDAAEHADLDRATGEVLLAQGERVRALEAMRRANASGVSEPLARPSLARALRSAGRHAEARQEYERMVATSPEPWEGHVAWAVAHLALGELYEDAGDIGRARATYAALAKAWEHADPDLPAVRKLRAAQKRLGS